MYVRGITDKNGLATRKAKCRREEGRAKLCKGSWCWSLKSEGEGGQGGSLGPSASQGWDGLRSLVYR